MKMKTNKALLSTIGVILIAGILIGTLLADKNLLTIKTGKEDNPNKLVSLIDFIEDNYVDSVDKKKIIKESDWRKYFGSNNELKQQVQKLGEDKYKREILKFCRTKGECSYYEAKLQFQYDVLMSDDYYNEYIQCRIHAKHLRKNDGSE